MSSKRRNGKAIGRLKPIGYSKLKAELDKLERTDPAVRDARRQWDSLPERMARYDRHMAARKAVGKRPVREDPS